MKKKTFTCNEFKLLNKGLRFCPSLRKYNGSKYTKDINGFIRRIKLKAHFKTTQSLAKKDVVQFLKKFFRKKGSEKGDP